MLHLQHFREGVPPGLQLETGFLLPAGYELFPLHTCSQHPSAMLRKRFLRRALLKKASKPHKNTQSPQGQGFSSSSLGPNQRYFIRWRAHVNRLSEVVCKPCAIFEIFLKFEGYGITPAVHFISRKKH